MIFKSSFIDIEKYVGLDFWKPHYKMASHSVHGNIKGANFDLGNKNNKTMLAGPSLFGFADPIDATIIDLYKINICLLLHDSNDENLVECNFLKKLLDKIQIKLSELININ
jgi:hypothetical protein